VYALIAAHLAQLLLNWHNDAFVLRQRVNLFGDRNSSNGALPPEALPAFLSWRLLRLFAAGLVLIVTLKFNWCKEDSNELCDTDVSHAAHAFGALGGLLTGLIFLRARSFKRPIHLFKNVLFMLVYGLSFCYIINKYFFEETYNGEREKNCPWIEYERVCQTQCYEHRYTDDLNCTVNICMKRSH